MNPRFHGWHHMGCLGWQVQPRTWISLDLYIWYLGTFLISFSSQLDLYKAFRSLRIWFYNSFPWNWTVLWKIKSLHIFSIRNPSRLVQIDAWVPSLPPKSTNWLPSTAQALPLRRCNMGLASCKQWLKLCRNQAFKISFARNLWSFPIELSKKGFGEKNASKLPNKFTKRNLALVFGNWYFWHLLTTSSRNILPCQKWLSGQTLVKS